MKTNTITLERNQTTLIINETKYVHSSELAVIADMSLLRCIDEIRQVLSSKEDKEYFIKMVELKDGEREYFYFVSEKGCKLISELNDDDYKIQEYKKLF